MLEVVGDVWAYLGSAVIVITTNGTVAKTGRAVFGRGVACQAATRFPALAEILGKIVQEQGNHACYLGHGIVSFPVEETPWSLPDLQIIQRSACELRSLADASGWDRIVVPRPGCGGGGLAWKDVRPILEPFFDERFIIISQGR